MCAMKFRRYTTIIMQMIPKILGIIVDTIAFVTLVGQRTIFLDVLIEKMTLEEYFSFGTVRALHTFVRLRIVDGKTQIEIWKLIKQLITGFN